jgi:hypothetical protein
MDPDVTLREARDTTRSLKDRIYSYVDLLGVIVVDSCQLVWIRGMSSTTKAVSCGVSTLIPDSTRTRMTSGSLHIVNVTDVVMMHSWMKGRLFLVPTHVSRGCFSAPTVQREITMSNRSDDADKFLAEVRARAAFATLQNKIDVFEHLTHCRVRFDNDGIHFEEPIDVKETT